MLLSEAYDGTYLHLNITVSTPSVHGHFGWYVELEPDYFWIVDRPSRYFESQTKLHLVCSKDMCVPDRPSRFSLCICFRRSSEYVSFGDVQVLVQCILYLQHNSRRPGSCPTNRDIEWQTVGDVCVNGMFHCTLYLRFIVLFYSSIFRALGAFCQLQRIVSGDTGNV
jgi:hypothetical protein